MSAGHYVSSSKRRPKLNEVREILINTFQKKLGLLIVYISRTAVGTNYSTVNYLNTVVTFKRAVFRSNKDALLIGMDTRE